jgi:hypothetical protein
VREAVGAMHQTDRRASYLTEIRFGFDRERFYVRLDGRKPMSELLADGLEFSLTFLKPEGLRLSVPRDWRGRDVACAARSILELAVPLTVLGLTDGLAFFVTVQDSAGMELERHPAGHPLEIPTLNARFEARNWTA